ncbi:MAG: hypothetical protein ACTHU0_18310, partial [Kofleriaceae bacterium]
MPIVVSAGLAVGVFCGLLFGLGTGEDEAIAAPTVTKPKEVVDDRDLTASGDLKPPKSVLEGRMPTSPKADGSAAGSNAVAAAGSADDAGSGSAGSAAPAAGSAAPAAGSAAPAAGSAAPVPPQPEIAKLTVEIKPESVASTAKITVDGKDITGMMLEIPLDGVDKKEVKVAVKASGYKDVEQKVEVEGDTTLK